MGFPFVFRSSRDSRIAFNCRKDDRDGVVIIKCAPLEKKDDIKEKLGERDAEFKLIDGRLDMSDDGGHPKQIMDELDEYLKRMI